MVHINWSCGLDIKANDSITAKEFRDNYLKEGKGGEMREIKFRAWYEEEKKWVYATMAASTEDAIPISTPCVFAGGNSYVISQFTGLKDKNGKEIYEGDILEEQYQDGEKVYRYHDAVVEFADGGFRIKDRDKQIWELAKNFCKATKILGNIYENPELLKEQPK